ncbi:MAG: hypothetical protein ACXVPN_02035 [Bacteroidia bacterium]
MRKLFFCLLVLHSLSMLPQQINAQPAPVRRPISMAASDTLPKIYVGGGSGLEYFSGIIGVVAGYKLTPNLILKAGLGIGGWGRKFSAGITYYFKPGSSWGLGLSYSSSSGNNNATTNLDVINDSGMVVKQSVHIALLRASTVNLMVSKRWVFRKKNEFLLEGGYCVPVETDPYKTLDGSILAEKSKRVLRLQQPGGYHLILGISLLFGLK